MKIAVRKRGGGGGVHRRRRSRPAAWLPLAALLAALSPVAASASCPGTGCVPDRVTFQRTPHFLVDEALRRHPGEWGTMRFPAPPGRLAYEGVWLRLHARTERPGNPIFFVAGGPAISGIEVLAETVPDLDALLRMGDVVVVEQRGAGQTRPQLDCGQTWDLPLDRPDTRAGFIEEARRRFDECRQEWERRGADLTVPSTRTYADDIALVADHLGYERVRLLAHSYGTQIALDFIRRHGDRVERAVLAGVMGPADALRLPSSADRVFSDLRARIASDPALAAAYGDPDALLRQAVARLRERPLTVSVPAADGGAVDVVLGDFALRWQAVQMLGRRSEIGRLPLLLHAIAHDERPPRTEDLLQAMARTALRDRRGPLSRRSSAAHYLAVCASGVSPERLSRIHDEDRDGPLGFVLHVALPEACDAWGVPPLGEDYRAPIVSEVPVLMVSGSLDVRTPIGQAEALLPGLRNGVHLEIHQAGHGDLFLHEPVNAGIHAFLAGVEVSSQAFELAWPEIELP